MAPSLSQLALSVDRDADLPLGAQLAGALRERIASGTLGPGDRLPSVRDLAAEVGVNVNTVRSVYARLERDGLTRSEQGRGTFVAAPEGADAGEASEAATRHDLRRRIAMLEAELVKRPQLVAEPLTERSGAPGRLPTTEELSEIHDELMARLRRLDDDREEIVRHLEQLRAARALGERLEDSDRSDQRRSTASRKGARVRWVGA